MFQSTVAQGVSRDAAEMRKVATWEAARKTGTPTHSIPDQIAEAWGRGSGSGCVCTGTRALVGLENPARSTSSSAEFWAEGEGLIGTPVHRQLT